jgi:hypothetical protein
VLTQNCCFPGYLARFIYEKVDVLYIICSSCVNAVVLYHSASEVVTSTLKRTRLRHFQRAALKRVAKRLRALGRNVDQGGKILVLLNLCVGTLRLVRLFIIVLPVNVWGIILCRWLSHHSLCYGGIRAACNDDVVTFLQVDRSILFCLSVPLATTSVVTFLQLDRGIILCRWLSHHSRGWNRPWRRITQMMIIIQSRFAVYRRYRYDVK